MDTHGWNGRDGGVHPGSFDRQVDELSDRPVKGLVSELLEQAQRLLRAELRLARAEVRHEAKKAARGGGLAAAGAGLLILGAFALVAFLVLALSQLMPAWLAAGLVTLLLLGGGAALASAGLKRFKTVRAPRKTVQTLKEDARWAKETMSSAKSQMHGHA